MIKKGFIFTFTLFCFVCHGQNFKANALIGLSTSQVSSDGLGGFDKYGLKLGASVNYNLNKATRSEFSMYYIDKGSNNVNSLFQIDLSYIESSFTIQKSRKGFIYEGGVSFGVLIDGITYNNNGNQDRELSLFNSFDIGAILGVGIKLKENIYLFGELSNTLPLFPIQEHPDGISYQLNKGKYNSVFSFSLRYLLSKN